VRKLLVVLWLVLAPVVAAAQNAPLRLVTPRVAPHQGSSPSLMDTRQPASSSANKRDSLKNGALIGAIVGAAALGGFGLFLCRALDDTGDPDCFPHVIGIAAVGAGIGLGAGVAIDVLLARQGGTALRLQVTF
jgi:hypothetical protein